MRPSRFVAFLAGAVTLGAAAPSPAQPFRPRPFPEKPVRPDAPGRWTEGLAMRAFGLRAGESRVGATGGGDAGAGIGLVDQAVADLVLGSLTARYRQIVLLGGGTSGFQGALGVDVGVGWRPAFGERHGPLLRIGARGHLFGDDALYGSYLEAPQGQVGYQLIRRAVHLEIAGRVGPSLVGRYSVLEGTRRRLGGNVAYGGYAVARAARLLLDVGVTRIGAAGAPVEEIRFLSCGLLLGGAVCLDGWHLRGEMPTVPRSGTAEGTFVGLSFLAGSWEIR